jgi:hypothetical protein
VGASGSTSELIPARLTSTVDVAGTQNRMWLTNPVENNGFVMSNIQMDIVEGSKTDIVSASLNYTGASDKANFISVLVKDKNTNNVFCYGGVLNSNITTTDKIYFDFDVPKITINRGNYAAMERHYILGEINSFDDLEKYRNNYFKL